MLILCADDVRSKDRGSQAATQQPEPNSDQQAETHAQHDHESASLAPGGGAAAVLGRLRNVHAAPQSLPPLQPSVLEHLCSAGRRLCRR